MRSRASDLAWRATKMRSKAIALATATGAVLGCGQEPEYAWGTPYQPGAAVDDDDDPPEDEAQGDSSSEGSGPPQGEASGPGSTSGLDPMLTDSASVGESSGSTGDPGVGESPYQGGWDVGDCQDEMQSQVADFFLTDSFGDQIRLYDFCHKAIFLTAGSFW
jgi:hypothetical protein